MPFHSEHPGFWVRQPLVTMVFDGCPPLVRGWNGQVPSNKSIVGQIKSVGLWSMWVGSYGYGHWSDHIGDYCSSNVKVDPKLSQINFAQASSNTHNS